MPPTVNDQVAM